MKKSKKNYHIAFTAFLMLFLSVFLTGCSSDVSDSISSLWPEIIDNAETVEIVFSGDDISVDNAGVSVSNAQVTIMTGGTYLVSGSLNDGQLIVDVEEKDVEIILNGVTMHNSTGSVIYVKEAGNVDIALAENTENMLSDGDEYDAIDTDEDVPNAVIYSMSDLDIEGADGAMLVIEANYNDAIVSKDDLEIKDVDITLTAEDDGLRGKDSVTVQDATLVINAGGDAIKSDNDNDEKGVISLENSDITVHAGDDGINATNLVEIFSGNIGIVGSVEGIEGKVITVHDGNISVVSSDDGINVSSNASSAGREGVLDGGTVNIYGGTITLNTGGDGFDSNGSAVMAGGTLIINGPSENRNGAIDVNGSFMISGGTLIAVGSSGMAETPDASSSQKSIQVNFETSQSAGTELSLVNSGGSEVFSFVPEKTFQSITYSGEYLVEGETYTLQVDGIDYTSLTIESTITIYGESTQTM